MMDLRILLPALLLVFGLATVFAQTSAPAKVCEARNGTSCEECLSNVTCLWCITTKSCITYPVRTILPPHALCPLNDARWGLCWMNFQALIITLAVVGGVIIIAFFICLFCCCKCENFGTKRFEAKMERQANKTRTKQEESRQCSGHTSCPCCIVCHNPYQIPSECNTKAISIREKCTRHPVITPDWRAEMKQRHDEIRKKYGLSGQNPYSRFA